MILSPESIVEINHIWRLSYNLPPPNLLILLLLEDFVIPWIIFDMKSTWNFGCANQHFPSPWLNIHQKSTGGHVRPFAATNLLTKLPRSHGRSLSSPDPHLGFDGIQELVRVRLAALLGSKEIMWVWHFVGREMYGIFQVTHRTCLRIVLWFTTCLKSCPRSITVPEDYRRNGGWLISRIGCLQNYALHLGILDPWTINRRLAHIAMNPSSAQTPMAD